MKFVDPTGHDPGTTRTAFHKSETDVQLAINDLELALASMGYILIVKAVHPGGNIEFEMVIPN